MKYFSVTAAAILCALVVSAPSASAHTVSADWVDKRVDKIHAKACKRLAAVFDRAGIDRALPSFCDDINGKWSDSNEISADLSVSSSTVSEGETVTISWNSTNASRCTASDGWSGNKRRSGEEQFTVSETTTYTITCKNKNSQMSSSVTVAVDDLEDDEGDFDGGEVSALNFSANPDGIEEGETTTLSWDAAEADSCMASGAWEGDKSTEGSEEVEPTATLTYTLACGNDTGTTTESVTVEVVSEDGDDESGTESARLVISEVQYGLADEQDDEWIEIYNAGEDDVDLSGWEIADDTGTDTLAVSELILAPNQYAVVVPSTSAIEQGGIPNDALILSLESDIGGNGLSRIGDVVRLYNDEGMEADAVSYGINTDAFDVAVEEVDEGYSIARTDPDADDTDTAFDWEKREEPTPGE